MRSHLGVLALEKPGTPQPTNASREVSRLGNSGENIHTNSSARIDAIPDLRANKPSLRTSHESTGVPGSRIPHQPSFNSEDSVDPLPKPEKLPPVNWRAIVRHTSVIIAIPIFTLLMATLYSRGLFKSTEPPGVWLLMVRQYADQDWCFHAIVVLFFVAAILMVGKKLTYGMYVLSVAWSVLFIRNL